MKDAAHAPHQGESGAQAMGAASGLATHPQDTPQDTQEGCAQGLDNQVKRDTQAWLERSVIGLNLCPFAKKVWLEGRVRWSVYGGESTHEALDVLALEIQRLATSALSSSLSPTVSPTVSPTPSPAAPPSATQGPTQGGALFSPTQALEQTTLLILPRLCADFWDFLSLVQASQRVLKAHKCVGVLQIAHFHPAYQFAHTQESDPENYINRSPYPTLHLLRERDIEWAVQTHPDVSVIYQHNVQRMNLMGHDGWAQLGLPTPGVGAIKGPD